MTDIERIGNLPGPLQITCYAPGCGWAVVWSRETAIARLGAWRQPYCARVALRCRACGIKGQVAFDTGPHLAARVIE